jgi:hypothetical protein
VRKKSENGFMPHRKPLLKTVAPNEPARPAASVTATDVPSPHPTIHIRSALMLPLHLSSAWISLIRFLSLSFFLSLSLSLSLSLPLSLTISILTQKLNDSHAGEPCPKLSEIKFKMDKTPRRIFQKTIY